MSIIHINSKSANMNTSILIVYSRCSWLYVLEEVSGRPLCLLWCLQWGHTDHFCQLSTLEEEQVSLMKLMILPKIYYVQYIQVHVLYYRLFACSGNTCLWLVSNSIIQRTRNGRPTPGRSPPPHTHTLTLISVSGIGWFPRPGLSKVTQ